MIKDKLRGEMRAKRRALTDTAVMDKSYSIRKKLFSLECVKKANAVCVFLSAFNEPDTMPAVKKLWDRKCKVIAPVSDTETNTLLLSYIDSADDLHKGAYGISEPAVIKKTDDKLDVIIVPGLAFDRKGGRMGFGKGYYDRLLKREKSVKIGLCYDFQLFDDIPKEAHDVPMDYIITEQEIIKVR